MNKPANSNENWLESQVVTWCKSLRQAGITNELSLAELRDHLRSLVLKYSDAGHKLEDSLRLAKEQIGDPAYLYEEFRKNRSSVQLELPMTARLTIFAFLPPLWFFLISDMLENIVGRSTPSGTFWVPVELPIGLALMVLMSIMIIRRINWLRLVFLTVNYGFMFLFGVMFILMVIAGLDGAPTAVWKLDKVLFESTGTYISYVTVFGLNFAATVFISFALTRPLVRNMFRNPELRQSN